MQRTTNVSDNDFPCIHNSTVTRRVLEQVCRPPVCVSQRCTNDSVFF